MAGKNGNLTRVLISLAFIALGLGFAINAVFNIIDGDFEAVLGLNSVLGILMFGLGLLGIANKSPKACKILAVVVCLLAIASFVLTVLTFDFNLILSGITTTFVWALLAWIYFDIL